MDRPLRNSFIAFYREVLLPVLIGLSIGYVFGLTLSFEEIDSIDHIAQIDEDAPESTLFFLRCLILLHPDTKKPLNFITAIRDTYGSVCNQTIFYTNSGDIQKKAADQYVIVVDSTLNGFYWSYFQHVVDSSSKAIKTLSRCNGILWPRATESALVACAKEEGIKAMDPVDEDGMHLFHDKDLKTLIPEAYQAKHNHGGKLVLGCCSDHAISFGQLSYKDIRLADFASVHWKVFGLGGVEEVNASYAIDPSTFTTNAKTTTVPSVKTSTVRVKKPSNDSKLIKPADKPENEKKKTAT
ncbi:hypothetical protein TELCIR_06302 [Teladorsagia circumcincta]|uniref:Uncharacterized protein n=1 Tax=Teladorsagia circumcincta TaxID=45464 RepID=A0A2G9UNG3_TELCI|nr:hypothetical protein TELCIR_06302 [Teladorsagia circumcincta]